MYLISRQYFIGSSFYGFFVDTLSCHIFYVLSSGGFFKFQFRNVMRQNRLKEEEYDRHGDTAAPKRKDPVTTAFST